ncbi:MAG: hypothetical protein E5V29_21980 [Mesorhizobium sp.]|nr:MAG: hypothetical protein E5V29_21980 [Mesorhizobium sp.]
MTAVAWSQSTPIPSLSDNRPYDLDLFMEKHDLSRRAAQVILHSNGPSRIQCDAAAEAFVRFKQWREDARMKPPSPSIKSSIGAPRPLPRKASRPQNPSAEASGQGGGHDPRARQGRAATMLARQAGIPR